MKRIALVLCLLLGMSMISFSQEIATTRVTLEIRNVVPGRGKVYGGIFFTSEAYENRMRDIALEYETSDTVVISDLTLPVGECLINCYQDLDDNGECKTGLFRVPKEPVGITNWDGKGIPGPFEDLKLEINAGTERVVIELCGL